jgi:hypothetical protein
MMITSVRKASRFGSCNLLGELVAETSTRYIYRRRHTSQTAFVDKGSPSIHIEPCQTCLDYRNAHRDTCDPAQPPVAAAALDVWLPACARP